MGYHMKKRNKILAVIGLWTIVPAYLGSIFYSMGKPLSKYANFFMTFNAIFIGIFFIILLIGAITATIRWLKKND